MTISGSDTAAADGLDTVEVRVTAHDVYSNPIPGATVVLTSTSPWVNLPPPLLTGDNGQVTGSITSTQVGLAQIGAIISDTFRTDVEISGTVTATFKGAELVIAKSAPAEVTAGYPITYYISLANNGFLTATQVVVTDTLPNDVTFISQSSAFSYTFDENENELVWEVGSLGPNQAPVNLTVVATAPLTTPGVITNQVVVTSDNLELETDDNERSVSTTLKEPVPLLAVTPVYATLAVTQGMTHTLVITVQNAGTGTMTETTLIPPPYLSSWVSLSQTDLGDIPPGQAVTVTVEADAGAITPTGHYRDIIEVKPSSLVTGYIYLDVHVQGPKRDVRLTLQNNAGAVVADAAVTLAEDILVVTEGQPAYETYYRQGATSQVGQLTFPALETDKSYHFSITADHHVDKSGDLTVTVGSSLQDWTEVLNGLPALTVSPGQLTFGMARGTLAQQDLILHNPGAVTLTNLSFVTPATLPWVYLGQPATGTVIAPGGHLTVSVNAAPPITTEADFYGDSILVNAGSESATADLEISLHDGVTRTLCIDARTAESGPVNQATVQLRDQRGQWAVINGQTETLPHLQVAQTNSSGRACFEGLTPGPYLASIGRGEQLLGEQEVEVIPGSGDQVEEIEVDEPSLLVNWSVTPTTIQDVYTTVMTMTFVPDAFPQLAVSPRTISLCDLIQPESNGVVSETVTIYNMYPVTFTNAIVELEAFGNVRATITTTTGASVTTLPDGAISLPVGTIGPNENLNLTLYAGLDTSIPQQCLQGDAGAILLKVSANYKHYLPDIGWYGFRDLRYDISGGQLLNQPFTIPLKLINRGYPDEGNLHTDPPVLENVHLIPPQNLDWMSLSQTSVPSIPVNGEIDFNLLVDPPDWLAHGFYYDHILITATNGITAMIGIEAEMDGDGLRVETQFVTPLDPSSGPLAQGAGSRTTGLAYPLSYIPFGQGIGLSGGEQYWQSVVNDENQHIVDRVDIYANAWQLRVIHCECDGGGQPQQPTRPQWSRVGNQLIATHTGKPGAGVEGGVAFAPEFKDDIVRLAVTQRFVLEREAFEARLELTNGLANDITDLEVDISIVDVNGIQVPYRQPGETITPTSTVTPALPADSVIPTQTLITNLPTAWQESAPVNFLIIPETPTDLSSLGQAGSATDHQVANWTIVPDAIGVTDPFGQQFFVQATINYKVNGVDKTVTTSQEMIIVHPQPKILLDYFIPRYVEENTPFDWIVVATNVGYGTARNFRVGKPQPYILKQSDQNPTSFTFLGPSTLSFGDLDSGQQVVGTWQLVADNSGTFTDLQSGCIHEDYKGVELPPLIYCHETEFHFIENPPLAESQQWGKEDACMIGSYQAFDSDPVNTYSGNFTYSHLDVNIPTWGPALEFERSYNSRDTEVGPLGPGWTHNYNLELIRETYIGQIGGVFAGQQDLMAVRLPHGSRAYFEIDAVNNTFTPLPGVRAELVRQSDTYTLTQPGTQMIYVFNAAQKLAAIQDANGNRIELTYSNEITPTERRLLYASDPAGRQLTFDYDEGRLIKMTDPLSRTYLYTYTNGYLTAATDFRGQTTSFTYTQPITDTPGRLVSITDPNGHVEVTNHYDAKGRVDWQEDAQNRRTTFSYSASGTAGAQTTTTTDPRGNQTTDIYNDKGLLIKQIDAAGFFEEYQYNDDYNMTRRVDKNGHDTGYVWNDCGCDFEVVTDPLGYTTHMTYDAKHQVTSITDERGYTTTITYDDRTNPLTVTNPISGVRQFTYGARGELLSKTDENNQTTYYGYDSYGNTTVITDALDQVTYLTYDLAGRLLSTVDALERETTYSYDPGDHLLQVVDPLTGTTSFTYDNVGNRLSLADALGRLTTYTYDERNDLIQISDPLSQTHTFTYDVTRNLSSETNGKGQTTTYQYDGLNRVLTITNALSGTMSYTYDPVGNRLSERNANGHATRYEYDDNDRIVKTIYPDTSEMTAVYDQADNLLSLTDGENRTLTYEYDALGRVTIMADPITGTVVYSYDAVGNQTGLTDAAGRTTTYSYDALNRLIEITDPLSGTTEVGYDATGNRTSLTDAEGRTTTFTYDNLNRLIQTRDALSGTTTYTYGCNSLSRGESLKFGRL